MNKLEYGRQYQRKIASERADRYWRERDAEMLDAYGVATYQDPVQTPEEAMIEREEHAIVAKAMLKLPARREYVLRAHYGINVEPQTLEEIGRTFGITGSAIKVIEYKALRSLTHPKSGLLKKLRPELYEKERARLDAAAKQAIADDMARVARERQADRERMEQKWNERNDAAAAAARWARAKERLKELDEKHKVADLAQWEKKQRDQFNDAYDLATIINASWDKELLRREIAQEIEIEMMWKRKERDERPQQRDWLWVASEDRKQA